MGRLRKNFMNGHNQSGYSLIGTAILILVIGMFSVAGIAVYQQYSWTEKSEKTNANMEIVKNALMQYKALEGRLPCPARLTSSPITPEFGIETNCGAGAVSGTFEAEGRGTEEISFGAVPVRTLNIDESTGFDGWNHRIVYAVTRDYTNLDPDLVPLDHEDRGAIFVVDGEGDNATNEAGNVIYTLLAPGSDTRGAYSVEGIEVNDCDVANGQNCSFEDNPTLLSNMMRQWGGSSEHTAKLNYSASTVAYEWRVPDWGPCIENEQTREEPKCYIKGTETEAPNVTLCGELIKPVTEQTCRGEHWAYKDDVCPDQCGDTATFQHERILYCEQDKGGEIPNSECSGHDEPPQEYQTCSQYTPCPVWGTIGCPSCIAGGGYSGGGGSGGSSDSGVTYYSYHGYDFTTDSNGNSWAGNTPYNSGTPSNYGNMTASSGSSGSSSSSSSSSGSSSSRVICTHFYRRGRMSRALWRADLDFTFNNLSWTTVRGYQFWGIPAVHLMRNHPWTEAIFWPLAINRAEEIAFQLGLRDKPNYVGKLIRWTMEPLCFLIGLFVPEQNWKNVHADMDKSLV